MTKALVIEPEQVFARTSSIRRTSLSMPTTRPSPKRRPATLRRISWTSGGHVRPPGIREHPQRDQAQGHLPGITYNHAGPAHLSLGQEAAAVGMAFALGPEDHIFGSHRSHGEILAKAFSAIRALSDDELSVIMHDYRDGAVLAPVEKGYAGPVAGLARRFFIYGAYSEIFARETGFNRGLGGSMHAFFAPFGIYPTTPSSAVRGPCPGGGAIQEGQPQAGIVVANIGTPRSAAARCGRASHSPAWTSTATCGTRPWAAACPSSSTAWTISTVWVANPTVRR